MRIPLDASQEVQVAFKEVWDALDKLPGLDQSGDTIDLRRRRIGNAGASVAPTDYVTRQEIERINKFEQSAKPTAITGNGDIPGAEPGSGLLVRLDGTLDFTGARTISANWSFEPIGSVAPFTTSKTTVVTNLNSDQLDGNDAETGSGDIMRLDGTADITGARAFTDDGPFSFGGAIVAQAAWTLNATISAAGSAIGLHCIPTVQAQANASGYGLNVFPTIEEAASGTHAQFASLLVQPPTITAGAATLTNAMTVLISGAPTGATNNYALWIDGLVRWNDSIALGGGATPTFGTIGGSGPGTAGQNRWLRVNIQGNTCFLPAWV